MYIRAIVRCTFTGWQYVWFPIVLVFVRQKPYDSLSHLIIKCFMEFSHFRFVFRSFGSAYEFQWEITKPKQLPAYIFPLHRIEAAHSLLLPFNVYMCNILFGHNWISNGKEERKNSVRIETYEWRCLLPQHAAYYCITKLWLRQNVKWKQKVELTMPGSIVLYRIISPQSINMNIIYSEFMALTRPTIALTPFQNFNEFCLIAFEFGI